MSMGIINAFLMYFILAKLHSGHYFFFSKKQMPYALKVELLKFNYLFFSPNIVSMLTWTSILHKYMYICKCRQNHEICKHKTARGAVFNAYVVFIPCNIQTWTPVHVSCVLTLLNLVQPYNVGALSLIWCSVSSGGLFGTGAIAQQVVSSAARI